MRREVVVCFALLAGFFTLVVTFNIDTQMALVFKGNKGSYFGAASEILINSDGKWLLVGAPQDNFTFKSDVSKPGQVYRCKINLNKTLTTVTSGCTALNLRTGNRTDIADEHGESGQLLGSDVIITEEAVIACAPRWRNIYSSYSMTGFCHQIDKNNLDKSLRRFIRLRFTNNEKSIYSMSQFGFSGTATNNSQYAAVISAPNALSQKGGFALYQEENTPNFLEKYSLNTDALKGISHGSMFGYSLASGQFGDKASIKPTLAVGAPGFANEKGVIGSIIILTIEDEKMVQLYQLTGDQVGGGFGQVICVADVNGDGHDDVLAGNPYHFSSDLKGHQMIDVGSVDVYLGTGNDQILNQRKIVLHGMRQQSARFGSAITSVGDITNDGFNDIIIGAPYENEMKGAIYVFNGQMDMKDSKWDYSQRITASDVDGGLRAFGYQISRHLEDIDDNTYKDISVGAYLSDTTVVLRTRSIANVMATIQVNPDPIPLNSSQVYPYDNTDHYPYFKISVCFDVTGKGIERGMFINYNITADALRLTQKKRSRALMTKDGKATDGEGSITEENVLIKPEEQKCDVLFAYVPAVGQDFFQAVKSPLNFEVNFELSNESIENHVLPIMNKELALKVEKSVPFLTECENGICKADFGVEVTPSEPSMVLGESDEIKFNIMVANYGQPYNQRVTSVKLTSGNNTEYLRFSEFLKDGSQKVDCKRVSETDEDPYTLCNIYGLLYPHQFAKFSVTYDASNERVIPANNPNVMNKIEIRAEVTVVNDTNEHNNVAVGAIDIELEADVQVNGMSERDQIRLSDADFIDHTQTYYIENKGPSPVTDLLVTLALPVSAGAIKILDLNTVEVTTDEERRCEFVEGLLEIENHMELEKNDTLLKFDPNEPMSVKVDRRRRNITCANAGIECVYVQCHIQVLHPKVLRTIYTNLNLSETAFAKFLENSRRVSYIVYGKISVQDTSNFKTKLRKVNTPRVILDVYDIDRVAEQSSNIWIIVGVSGGSLVLFLLFGILLWKCGFFKRRKRVQMDEYRQKNQYRHTVTLTKADQEPFMLRH